jgi:AraC family transcriptional regulator
MPLEADRVTLDFRETAPPPARQMRQWRGVKAEHVHLGPGQSFAYQWSGPHHYIALHNIRLEDGQTRADDASAGGPRDLRERMTFIPIGCEVSGWSALTNDNHSFTALYFDADLLLEELDGAGRLTEGRPMIYFTDWPLRTTLSKIQRILNRGFDGDSVYAETLAMLAALEINQVQHFAAPFLLPPGGRLPHAQERLIRAYIEDHLHTDLSLSELAGLARLSRFHFTRAFRRTVGMPPHQFILHRRVERAKTLLLNEALPISAVAISVGFASQSRFSATFRRLTGMTPTQFKLGGG